MNFLSFLKRLVRYSSFLVRVVFLAAISLIPKSKKVWVFGAWFGKKFADNPKYFFNYIKDLPEGTIKPIWICKDHELIKIVTSKYHNDIDIYHHMSLLGIYYQLTASVTFVGHSISSDLNPWFISFSTKRIQMWHGIPLKKIGFDDELSTRTWHKSNFFKLLSNDYYDYILSSGNLVSTLFSSAFDIPLNKVVETGFPRNDGLLINKSSIGPKDYLKKSKFIYMPTFRDNMGDEISLFSEMYNFSFVKLEKFLDENDIELSLRVHPVNRPPEFILNLIETSQNINLSEDDDIYETLDTYDCLITDYSSIMFDYCLTKKPIIFSPFDLNKYLTVDRKMYFNYSDITAGYPIATDWNELMAEMAKVVADINSGEAQEVNPNLLNFHDNNLLSSPSFSGNVAEFVFKKYYNDDLS